MSLENLHDYSSLKEKPVSVHKGGIAGIIEKASTLRIKPNSNSAIIEEFNYEKNLIRIKYNSPNEKENKQEEFTIEDVKNGRLVFDSPDFENSVLLKIRKDELNCSLPLFNENAFGEIAKGTQERPINTIILEQWRVAVDSALKVSSQRQATNTLFFGALTVLISGVLFSDGFFDTSRIFQVIVTIIVSVLGICLCLAWMLHMGYYGKLNKYKYDIIRDMEKYLPVLVFTTEDVFFYSDYKKKKSFSKKERIIPILFIVAFIGIIAATSFNVCTTYKSDSKTNISDEANVLQSNIAEDSSTTGSIGETVSEVAVPTTTSDAGEFSTSNVAGESATISTTQE